ncbi:MAG: hypothetical protein LKE39_06935 [Sphaerochaeta sp.]|jgi:hypothetical protein|nr:hypothetical protein [Sphaerochaeta sp.]MCH3920190.1 hypothetical protein [Sphaerochaeta sp.]MCI2045391.1 hypothetical protein [Sphaerochaeta sp.]MCI2076770.1 hypothetical protein [Sphaerochaeta sp.]MCI2103602.1 hypothetical protein [Sphaerochaeta sp.]
MHPKQQALEDQLRRMCDALDNHLEDKYGTRYPLHPNRLERGEAASVAYDGLFSTGTQFTMGYGSQTGRGYLVVVDICTLDRVKPEDRAEIETEASRYLETLLPLYFPDRKLTLVKDGRVWKIIGDFSLGEN